SRGPPRTAPPGPSGRAAAGTPIPGTLATRPDPRVSRSDRTPACPTRTPGTSPPAPERSIATRTTRTASRDTTPPVVRPRRRGDPTAPHRRRCGRSRSGPSQPSHQRRGLPTPVAACGSAGGRSGYGTGMADVELRVPAPPERVEAVLADGWTYSDWVVGTAHIRDVDSDWPAPGSRIHHKAG